MAGRQLRFALHWWPLYTVLCWSPSTAISAGSSERLQAIEHPYFTATVQ